MRRTWLCWIFKKKHISKIINKCWIRNDMLKITNWSSVLIAPTEYADLFCFVFFQPSNKHSTMNFHGSFCHYYWNDTEIWIADLAHSSEVVRSNLLCPMGYIHRHRGENVQTPQKVSTEIWTQNLGAVRQTCDTLFTALPTNFHT